LLCIAFHEEKRNYFRLAQLKFCTLEEIRGHFDLTDETGIQSKVQLYGWLFSNSDVRKEKFRSWSTQLTGNAF
jgi:hypothetical protein